MRRPRILLADDQISLLVAYQKILRQDFDVVGVSSDGRALMTAAVQLQPDVIVVDLALPSLTELSAVHELKRLMPRTKILAIARKSDAAIASHALHEWASGVLLRRTASKELIDALRHLMAGKSYVTASLAKRLEAPSTETPGTLSHKPLTHRQREVLQLLAEGRTMKEAANILNLTTRTVAFHKYRIMKDFGLRTNVDLLKLAIREHLASAE
jgi:DNA-binding NarL/FixJ family response regulator